MPTQECFVCDTCGDHTAMQSGNLGTYKSVLERLPLGWYCKRVTVAVAVIQFQFFCSSGCVSMSHQ